MTKQVLFEEDGAFRVGTILSEAGSSFQVEAAHGKRTKVKGTSILLRFDGQALTPNEHPEGTHMITSGGPEDRKADRYLDAFAAAEFPDGWRGLVQGPPPSEDPGALVVRRQVSDPELGTFVFATVFGELIEAAPGRLRLEYSRTPWTTQPWETAVFG